MWSEYGFGLDMEWQRPAKKVQSRDGRHPPCLAMVADEIGTSLTDDVALVFACGINCHGGQMRRRILLSLVLAGLMACGSAEILQRHAVAQATSNGTMGSEDNPVRVSGAVMASLILNKVDPEYPQEAKDKKISGAVVLMAKVDRQGNVADLKAISGPGVLRDAALAAVKQWTYKPYQLNGQPVVVLTTMTVNFSLQQ
jgi:TonB family protein